MIASKIIKARKEQMMKQVYVTLLRRGIVLGACLVSLLPALLLTSGTALAATQEDPGFGTFFSKSETFTAEELALLDRQVVDTLLIS